MLCLLPSGALSLGGVRAISEGEKLNVALTSFGKDSFAQILVGLKHGVHIDVALYARVMFDEQISGEIPEHEEFIQEKAIPFLKREGIEFVTVQAENKTYTSLFNRVIGSGEYAGRLWAWPLCGRCYINRDLKARPMARYKRCNWAGLDVTQFAGIAKNEENRLARMGNYKARSLLAEFGYDESECYDICRRNNLLSPCYEFTGRNGCFFCPNAKRKELRHLYDNHPELWGRLMDLQALPNKSTELFNRSETFYDINDEFDLDDRQISIFDILQEGSAE